MSNSKRFRVQPGGGLRGELTVPGDKSISHRALMLGALAEGQTQVRGFLEGEDTLATAAALRAMGVAIERPAPQQVLIDGVGLLGLKPPAAALDLGNSGTSMRLFCGLLAGQRFDVELTGDSSLCRRPMGRIVAPLTLMGACIHTGSESRPPLRIAGGRQLMGVHYELPVASAQVKSGILLAGLYAQGQTCVTEPEATRDHTERMLAQFGYPVTREGLKVCLRGGGRLQATCVEVPADISSAAFFLVGAAIAPGSDLLLRKVGINPTRTGVIDILKRMGADIEVSPINLGEGEPIADLRVRSSPLHGIHIPVELVPSAIDEFPAIFIVAACAEGETVLTGAEELRVKESDRIAVMAEGLQRLGVAAQPRADGMAIRGGAGFSGGTVDSHGDHRVAMAFSMAALRAREAIEILDCANVDTSFPGFASLAQAAGLDFGVKS
jgi:3-phosphoshikimate 1-carboxyvinyltransferase